ncbi:Uncharacterized protein GBIM_12088, partial [Gryllus bimaculatus]
MLIPRAEYRRGGRCAPVGPLCGVGRREGQCGGGGGAEQSSPLTARALLSGSLRRQRAERGRGGVAERNEEEEEAVYLSCGAAALPSPHRVASPRSVTPAHQPTRSPFVCGPRLIAAPAPRVPPGPARPRPLRPAPSASPASPRLAPPARRTRPPRPSLRSHRQQHLELSPRITCIELLICLGRLVMPRPLVMQNMHLTAYMVYSSRQATVLKRTFLLIFHPVSPIIGPLDMRRPGRSPGQPMLAGCCCGEGVLSVRACVVALQGERPGSVWSRGPRSLFLRRYEHGFGFTLRHFIVYPPESYTVLQGDRRLGLRHGLSPDDPMDTIFVKSVREHSPAYDAGLATGDRIIGVNGRSVFGHSYQRVVQWIQQSGAFLQLLVYFGETAHNPETNQRPRLRSPDAFERRAAMLQQQQQQQQAAAAAAAAAARLAQPGSRSSLPGPAPGAAPDPGAWGDPRAIAPAHAPQDRTWLRPQARRSSEGRDGGVFLFPEAMAAAPQQPPSSERALWAGASAFRPLGAQPGPAPAPAPAADAPAQSAPPLAASSRSLQ